jgi:acyl-CoA thioesterase FadM
VSMSKIFSRTFRVRYSETNANGWVGPAEYLKFLVETAYDWGEAGGFGARTANG